MAFSINEFTSVLGKYGVAKASSYAVVITPPASINHSIISDLPLLCDSASVPGVSFALDENKYMGYGLSEKRPSAVTYDELNLTFIGDGSGQVYDFFRRWLALVGNIDGTSQTMNSIQQGFFNFPEEYWGTIDLYLYDIASNQYEHIIFDKIYPVALAPAALGWGNIDTLMQISVLFSYRSYSTETTRTISSTSTSTTNITNSNSRTLEQLETLLTNPNLETYEQRFDKMADDTISV